MHQPARRLGLRRYRTETRLVTSPLGFPSGRKPNYLPVFSVDRAREEALTICFFPQFPTLDILNCGIYLRLFD